MKKIYLVTGCFGFIGYHLCKALLDAGHHVVGVDKGFGRYPNILSTRAEELLSPYRDNRLEFFDFDLSGLKRPKKYPDYVEYDKTENKIWLGRNYDAVFHLAGSTGVKPSKDHPREYFDNNVTAFQYVLEKCQLSRVGKLIYASSSSVYGGSIKEYKSSSHQVSYYASTKRAMEVLAQGFKAHCARDLKIIGCRFFTVYGPEGRPDMAPMIFADSIFKGQKLTIVGPDKPLMWENPVCRDFTYIDDVVKALLTIENDKNINYNDHPIFDIGSGKQTSLITLAELIAKELNVSLPIVDYVQRESSDVEATLADLAYYEACFGKLNPTPIEVGIKKFIDWYKQKSN